jgi:hypothetical protein
MPLPGLSVKFALERRISRRAPSRGFELKRRQNPQTGTRASARPRQVVQISYVSFAFVSAAIFQDPSACFFHTSTSFPVCVVVFPFASVIVFE